MNIKSIKLHDPDERTRLANMLMAKHRFNDALFESIPINIEIQLDHPSFIFHRMYWNNCCTKTKFLLSKMTNDFSIIVPCSLSECIQYVQKCTPPRFQSRLQNEMVTVDDVKMMLELYLMDPSTGNMEYYRSVFHKEMHFEYIDTGLRPDMNKINMLTFPNEFTTYVEASTIPISGIISITEDKKDKMSPCGIQFIFRARSKRECVALYDFINKTDLFVDQVYEDPKNGIYVSAQTFRLNPILINRIIQQYKPFMT